MDIFDVLSMIGGLALFLYGMHIMGDALALGYAVNVITDGCRGVNLQPQDSSQAFMEMAAAGATLYTLDDWRETQA